MNPIKRLRLADIQLSLDMLCDSLYVKHMHEYEFIRRLHDLHKYIKWHVLEGMYDNTKS